MSAALSTRQAALLVALITCVAFINSFGGKFVYDDIQEIEQNPSMEQLLPPWDAMFVGNKLPARPLPYLTFAIDHAIWGNNPFGYHLANLAIHVIAAVALFHLVRLTLLSPRLRGRFGDAAVPLAMVIAMIWAVHPLQTQAVTYVYQRIESMTGMLCLVSLAAFARAASAGWSPRWLAVSVAASAAAMFSKENAVVLPLLILSYDWFFVSPEPPAAWPRDLWSRRGYYALLAGTWLVLGIQLAVQGGEYQEFKKEIHPPLAYALTQSGVILHYLRLAVWPVGQQFDYSSWPIASSPWQVLPSLVTILTLLVVTAVGTLRRRPWAWLGAAFFLVLAPTSSIMPIEAVANEHRMYLALASVVSAIVLAVLGLAGRAAVALPGLAKVDHRIPAVAAGTLIMLLVVATQFRNQLYTKVSAIWLDVEVNDPGNYRTNWVLACIFGGAGHLDAALLFAEKTLQRRPDANIFNDLAGFHSKKGDYVHAEKILRRGLELQQAALGPEHEAVLATVVDLAVALRNQGNIDEAAALCAGSLDAIQRVLGDKDDATISASMMASLGLSQQGEHAKAEALARAALATARRTKKPPNVIIVNATVVLADVLRKGGRPAEAEGILRPAINELRSATRRTISPSTLEEALASALEESGRFDEAVALRRRVATDNERQLGPDHAITRTAAEKLAIAMAAQRFANGDYRAAADMYRLLLKGSTESRGADHPTTLEWRTKLQAAEAAAAPPAPAAPLGPAANR